MQCQDTKELDGIKIFHGRLRVKRVRMKIYDYINCIPMPCNTLMKTIQREVLIFHDHLAMLDTSEELMDTSDKRRIFNSLEENSMAQATIMSFY